MKEVTAALLIEEGQILLAKRGSDDKLPNKWEFPGGKVEQGETPEECLKREIKEEFDIDVSIGSFFDSSIYDYEYGSIKLLAYWVYWNKKKLIPKVHEEVRWVDLKELEEFDLAPADIPIAKKLREYYDT